MSTEIPDDEYNGWTNRETWATALHIDNDEGLHETRLQMMHDVAEDSEASEYLTKAQVAEKRYADRLKDWVEGMAEEVFFPERTDYPATQALLGMFNDIGSVWRVNWDEIAKSWLSEEA